MRSPARARPRRSSEGSRYAAFLRGINVGGHRVKSDQLCACFEAIGARDVKSFRASGNVVFTTAAEPTAALTSRIEIALAEALGYAVATFLRTGGEVCAIADHVPFEGAAAGGKLQVALLARRPTQAARAAVLALATEQDRLAFGDRELYWLPSGGLLDSALNLKAIDLLLGLATRRTKNTVEQLASKYFR